MVYREARGEAGRSIDVNLFATFIISLALKCLDIYSIHTVVYLLFINASTIYAYYVVSRSQTAINFSFTLGREIFSLPNIKEKVVWPLLRETSYYESKM